MAKILLLGLETPMAEQLTFVLKQLGQDVLTTDNGNDVQVIFAPEGDILPIQNSRPGIPVIVVSPQPEVSKWLHALEQGAAEYCGAPFDARQLRWALNSSLARTNRVAA